MKLGDLLEQKKDIIQEKWFQAILDTYPADTAKFLKKGKDQFTNPVGHTISHEIGGLYEELLTGMNPEKISPFLESIIKIRAVQDFSPSQAIAFILGLKKIIRKTLKSEIRQHGFFEELADFEERIDALALLAFDIYMELKDKICEIRINEVKGRSFKLVERMNLMYEKLKEEQGIELNNNT